MYRYVPVCTFIQIVPLSVCTVGMIEERYRKNFLFGHEGCSIDILISQDWATYLTGLDDPHENSDT
jgi:hypothetical protein